MATQTRRHGGGIPGPCPPNDCLCPFKRKLCPPKRGLCSKKINRLGATGVQIEAQIGVCDRYFCNFGGLTPDFMTYLGWRPFFWRSPVFGQYKRVKFWFRPENHLEFQWRPFFFFFWDHPISAGKNVWISDFGRKKSLLISVKTFFFGRSPVFGRKNVSISDCSRKIPLNFWSLHCSFDPDWDKFFVPPCPSPIHIIKLLVPPQNLFLPPPVTLSWRRACGYTEVKRALFTLNCNILKIARRRKFKFGENAF